MKEQVNHPDHYQSGKIEAIEVIEAFFADDFHLANVFKYTARCKKKGKELEDLKKAQWYLNRRIDELRRVDLAPRGILPQTYTVNCTSKDCACQSCNAPASINN
jgi:hypothetical protein